MHTHLLGNRLCLAVIGMPRSGTTIVSSVINSLNNSIILGEPHGMVHRERPKKFNKPIPCETRYGIFVLYNNGDVLDQIESFADANLLDIYGFKEAWVPTVNPIELIEEYGDRIDRTVVTFRDPRQNFMSMSQLTSEGHEPVDIETFNKQYAALVSAVLTKKTWRPILLDEFRIAPIETVGRAAGLKIEGELEFRMYAGSGDIVARNAKKVYRLDRRPYYVSSDIKPAIAAYNELVYQITQG